MYQAEPIDLAPGSTGSAVVAVGDRSNVTQWNGTRWTTVNAPLGNVKLNAVNFTSQSTAWVVGRENGELRLDGDTTEHLWLRREVHEPLRNET